MADALRTENEQLKELLAFLERKGEQAERHQMAYEDLMTSLAKDSVVPDCALGSPTRERCAISRVVIGTESDQ